MTWDDMSQKSHIARAPFMQFQQFQLCFKHILAADSRTQDQHTSVPGRDESATHRMQEFSHLQSGRRVRDPPRSSREASPSRSSFRALWLSAIRVMYLGGPGFTAGRNVHSASASGEKALEGDATRHIPLHGLASPHQSAAEALSPAEPSFFHGLRPSAPCRSPARPAHRACLRTS